MERLAGLGPLPVMRALRAAWRELVCHPRRVAAAALSILVSLAFLVSTQVYSATQTRADAHRSVMYAAKADALVQTYLWHSPTAPEQRERGLKVAQRALASDPDVKAVNLFSQVLTNLTAGERGVSVMLTSTPEDQQLRWWRVVEGREVTGPREVVLSLEAAELLGVTVGDTVRVNAGQGAEVTVVGITHEQGFSDPQAHAQMALLEFVGQQMPAPDHRVLVPRTKDMDRRTPGSSGDGLGLWLLVRTAPGAGEAVASRTQAALKGETVLKIYAESLSGDALRARALAEREAETPWAAIITGLGSLVSLAVGSLVVGTTFSTLVAQRRRQTALLRLVGASRRQVAAQTMAEAALVAGASALLALPLGLGVGALAARLASDALTFGLAVPWGRVLVIVVAGALASVACALWPVVQAARVMPMEALQPAELGAPSRRGQAVRAGLATLLGAGGVWWLVTCLGRERPSGLQIALSLTLVGTALVLVGPATVSRLAAVLGAPLRRPVGRLAVANARRHPARSATTTAAVVVAVGVIAAISTAAAGTRASAARQLDLLFPADLTVQAAMPEPDVSNPNGAGRPSQRDAEGLLVGFSPDSLQRIRQTPGVRAAELLPTTEIRGVTHGTSYSSLRFTTVSPAAAGLLRRPVALTDDQIGLSREEMEGLRVEPGARVGVMIFDTENTELVLEVVELDLGPKLAVVSPGTFAKVNPKQVTPRPGLMVIQLESSRDAGGAVAAVGTELKRVHPGLALGGGAELKAIVGKILDTVTRVVNGLLAVAAAVALLGVGNTLGLAVAERRRESALLRALGLQRRALARMLTIEALLLAGVGSLLGALLGWLAGWAGGRLAATLLRFPQAGPQLPWLTISVAVVGVLVGAVLASLGPGRRAARAVPMEALADLG